MNLIFLAFAFSMSMSTSGLPQRESAQHDSSSEFLSIVSVRAKLQSPPFSRFTQILAVSNDGGNVLTLNGSRVGGYRIEWRYSLVPDYPDRLVFSPESHGWATTRFGVMGILGCLERSLGLAALRNANNSKTYGATALWAVFPLDRRTNSLNTNIIRFPKEVQIVSAQVVGADTLRCRVAEHSTTNYNRIELVEYRFKLMLDHGSTVVNAKPTMRIKIDRGYLLHVKGSTDAIRGNDSGPGWVSADANYAVFSNLTRVSLKNGSTINVSKPGQHGWPFFIGNELFSSVWASPYAATQERPQGSGLWKWSGKTWIWQSHLFLIKISLNGKYGVFASLPEESGGNPEWVLVEFKH